MAPRSGAAFKGTERIISLLIRQFLDEILDLRPVWRIRGEFEIRFKIPCSLINCLGMIVG